MVVSQKIIQFIKSTHLATKLNETSFKTSWWRTITKIIEKSVRCWYKWLNDVNSSWTVEIHDSILKFRCFPFQANSCNKISQRFFESLLQELHANSIKHSMKSAFYDMLINLHVRQMLCLFVYSHFLLLLLLLPLMLLLLSVIFLSASNRIYSDKSRTHPDLTR